MCSFFRTFALLMFPLLRPSYLQITTMFTSPPPSGLSSNVTFSVRLSLTSLKLTSIPSSSQPLSLLYICPSLPPQGISVCLLCCCISSIQIVPDTQVEVSNYLLNRFMTQVVAYIFKKKIFAHLGQNKHKNSPVFTGITSLLPSWTLPFIEHLLCASSTMLSTLLTCTSFFPSNSHNNPMS